MTDIQPSKSRVNFKPTSTSVNFHQEEIPIECFFKYSKEYLVDTNTSPITIYTTLNSKINLTFQIYNKGLLKNNSLNINILSDSSIVKSWEGVSQDKKIMVSVKYLSIGDHLITGIVTDTKIFKFGKQIKISVVDELEIKRIKSFGFKQIGNSKGDIKEVHDINSNTSNIEQNDAPVGTANISGITCTYAFPNGKCYPLRGIQIELYKVGLIWDTQLGSTIFSTEAVNNSATQYGLFPTSYIQGSSWVHPNDNSGYFSFGNVDVGSGANLYFKVKFIFHVNGDGTTGGGTEKFVIKDETTLFNDIITFTTGNFWVNSGETKLMSVTAPALSSSNGTCADEGIHAFFDCSKAFGYFKNLTNFTMDDIDIFMNLNSTSSPYATDNPDIHIHFNKWNNDYMLYPFTNSFFHEYAHCVQAVMRGGSFPAYGSGNSNHGGCANATSVDGVVEGWARFIPVVMRQDPIYCWTATSSWDISANTGGNAACDRDEWTEGAIWYDIWTEIVPSSYPHTNFNKISTSFKNHDPDLAFDFFNDYITDWGYAQQMWEKNNNHNVNYDNTAPSNPTTASSSSHSLSSWSTDRTIDMNWSGATDNLSGVKDYSWEFSSSSTTLPDQTANGSGTSTTSSSLTDGNNWYFHIRTRDNAGNWNSGAVHKGPYFIDGTAPSNPTSITSSSHTVYTWSADNTISISWSGASDGSGSGVAGYSWSWDNSPSTIPGTSVTGTGTSATSPALADGNNWYFHIRTKDIAGNWNSAAVHKGPFYIDANAPTNPTSITSSSHQTSTWSNDPTIDISWSGASDGNGSGIAGYSWIWDNTSTTIPGTTVMGTGNSTTSPTLPNANNWYFHIRTKDNVGNWNSSATHKGPFYIDVTNPSGTISINSGSTTTCLTNVTLTLNATDNLSGVSKMQFCNDGVSWSNWETYTTSKSWNLTTNGGNSSPGNKTVYAKFRDAAGNTSSTATDNIQLLESLPVSVSISVSNNSVCAGATVTFYSTYANGGNTPGFQWKKNNISIAGATNSTYSYIPSNNDAITCVLTSSELCTTGSPSTSNSITMTVNAQMPVGVSILPSSNPVCSGNTVVFTATPFNGGSSPGYQWKKGGIDIPGATNSTYSCIPLNNDVITCQMTSNLTCATGSPALSNAITMTVNQPAMVSVSIGASANNVCQGTSVTFTATPVNGGSSPGYQWKKNGINIPGATNSTYTYAPANGDAITCEITSNATCISNITATSNTVTMAVNPSAPVSILISASSNPVCSGTSVTFTATPTNGGSSSGYQWKKNNVNISGATNQTYSYVPTNGEVITCVLNSNANCATGSPATSNAVTMVVNSALTAGITISASSNPACAGTVVTFTATPVNGGSSPGYQWKKGGINIPGATNSTYGYIPLNNDVITCQMTSNLTCATGNPASSNAITMTINQPVPVSVTIDASANGICQGTSVTFTATLVNGGSSPGYQWKKNGVNISGATNSTYTYAPANNDAITCELTSNATCISNTTATSNTINIAAMPPAPVSISITASANPVCSGTAVTFNAAFVNGGIFPGFQWKKNGTAISGATNSTYTYTPANNDIITCVLTSNVVCPVGNPATSNAINMSVTTSIPAGVSILASTNNVCAGTTVHFTAYPVNGGTSPGYQWKKNGVLVGTNQPTYSCVPQNFDVITCTLTSNLSCASGNPVTSNSVIMNITTPAVVGVLIYASANPSCSGAPVTYTAMASNQGTTPVYRWMKNGVTVGSNSSMYSYIPEAGDLITCELTSNATCIQNPTAISNVITTALIPSVPVSVSIIASANPVCSGTPVTFTASSVNGGNTPVYQWKKNGTEIGPNSPVFTYTPGDGDVITCTLTSSVNCPTGSPATSNAITMGVNTSLAAGISVVPSANPACQGSTVTFMAAPVNGGTAPVYQWKVNGINVGVNTPAYSFIPLNNDQVWCEMTSNLGCATGNPALSNTVTMVMQQIYPVTLTVSASANPVCLGSQVIFTAHPLNGGAAPVYQWKRNGIITGTNDPVLSLVPDNNDLITCQLTSSELCTTGNPAVSNQVIMTVNPNLQPGVTVTASENPVCNGTLVSFTATPVNGGSSPGYQWRVNNTLVGTNNPSYTYIPSDNDYIVCDLVSNASCITGNPATSNVIRMSVDNQLFVGVSITVASSTVCIGSPAFFTAHPVNGGLSPVYQWRINGINAVSAGPTFSYIPVQGDVVTCEMTSSISCAMNNPVFSNPIEMTTVQPVPVSVSITTPLSTVCQGRPITYTAFHINGGPTPSYQWKVNGINAGTNNQLFTYIPSNGDVVSCILTTSLTCVTNTTATSNVIQMTVDPLQPVSLAITPSANPVLPGTAVTFTATWTNGGSSPVFQWKVNGISVGSNSPVYTYVPNNLDEVVCEMTSDIICVTVNPVISNPVNMVVTFLPVGITISSTANNICAGSYIEFTATPVNGGTDPQYQWKVNGIDVGTNSQAYGYTPIDQDVVTCVLTSNAPNVTGNPATSNPVIMIVKSNLPVSVTISPDVNPVCPQSQVTLTAVAVNGGTAPFYQWKVNGINSGVNNPVFTYFPSNGDIVVCRLTSSEECTDENPVMSNGVTMQVPTVIPVSLTIGASANPVNSGTPVTFTANPVNPGNAPFYQWKVNGVDRQNNTPVFSYIPANGDQVVCLMTSGHSCASVNPAVSNTIIMTVNIVPAITVLTPDGGEYWIRGSVQNITWTDNISENVKIELLKGETYYETLVSSTPSTGSWSWTIPADQQVGIDYRIRITSVSDNAITDNSNASFKIMANVVSNLVVQNMEISNGMNSCFDALNTITVAGNGSFFHVTGGSYVTFIAGMNILFMPGTHIYNGGMMHGYIAPTGPFCGTMAPSFINVTAGIEDPVDPITNQRILIYPNPTTGKITLEFVPENLRSGARIYLYSMNGAEVLQKDLPQMKKETFTLDFLTPGIYLCRIVYNGKQELVKIVML